MSPTLFWYVFKDLLRIFALTVLALAGIMSFGGLLRPLTQNGLEASQVGRMLAYLLPAMTTYSLPIAALFATTMVYGRLSADNELTACRAGGISYLSIATPAFLLGLFVSIFSLLLLCFIVPRLSLDVEKILKSNIARFVANQIDKTHQIRLGQATIFAQEALVPAPDEKKPEEQIVVLTGPMIVTYEQPKPPENIRVPRELWMARRATAYISNHEDDQRVTFFARLDDGTKFPRDFTAPNATQVGIESLNYGPITMDSPVREHPKFMPIDQLKKQFADRSQNKNIRGLLSDFIRIEQETQFRNDLLTQLNTAGSITLETGSDTYTITKASSPAIFNGSDLVIPTPAGSTTRDVKLIQQKNARPYLTAAAKQIRIRCTPVLEDRNIAITAELYDAVVTTPDGSVPHASFPRAFRVPMPAHILALKDRKPEEYLNSPLVPEKSRQALRHALISLGNYIQSEMHARSSFAVSCLILVIVGACLGMMFKSGNFLSAFAVSVIPALVCIALVVVGQHTVENLPQVVTAANNPLRLGVAMIWSGNVIVAIIGVTLMWRLQRQ